MSAKEIEMNGKMEYMYNHRDHVTCTIVNAKNLIHTQHTRRARNYTMRKSQSHIVYAALYQLQYDLLNM